MPISILLLDDHAVVRDGLQALLAAQPDLRVAGSFGVAAEAVRFASESPPDGPVLDIAPGGPHGTQEAQRTHDLCPETPILLLSVHASPPVVCQTPRAGPHR